MTPMERFERFVMPEPNSGCWLWMGAIGENGYARFWDGEHLSLAHRFSYTQHRGPIPKGLILDHKCRVRCCVNPDHTEPVTHMENAARGLTGQLTASYRKAKTHCPAGHEYTEKNTYVDRKGCRSCRRCKADYAYWRRH